MVEAFRKMCNSTSGKEDLAAVSVPGSHTLGRHNFDAASERERRRNCARRSGYRRRFSFAEKALP